MTRRWSWQRQSVDELKAAGLPVGGRPRVIPVEEIPEIIDYIESHPRGKKGYAKQYIAQQYGITVQTLQETVSGYRNGKIKNRKSS